MPKLELVLEKITGTQPTMELKLLQRYAGTNMSESEAGRLSRRIADHKWYVSERLSRDVGFHVAAVDYLEHFHDRTPNINPATFLTKVRRRASRVVRTYFESKGKMPFF
jgi:hypothetical protein